MSAGVLIGLVDVGLLETSLLVLDLLHVQDSLPLAVYMLELELKSHLELEFLVYSVLP